MDNTNDKTRSNQPVPSSQPVAQSSSVGLVQKEQEVPISSSVQSEISEIIKASEEGPHVSKEVREVGVKKVSDRFPLTKEHTGVGIQHAGESTPVQTQPSGLVKIPEIREVKVDLQISPIYSARWLAEVKRRVLKMFGLWKEGK